MMCAVVVVVVVPGIVVVNLTCKPSIFVATVGRSLIVGYHGISTDDWWFIKSKDHMAEAEDSHESDKISKWIADHR